MRLDKMAPATHDHDTLSPHVSNRNYTSHTEIAISPLLSIPRELRDEIYGYLLRCGDLAILRTSKQVGHEAKERLHREGVFRIKMRSLDDGDGDAFSQQNWESLQNFHVRLYIEPGRVNRAYSPMYRQLFDFARHNESSLKRECLITIEDTTSMPRTPICHGVYKIQELFAEIARLAVCMRLIEIYTPKPFESCGLCRLIFAGREHDEHLDVVDKKLIVDNLRTLKGRLDPIFGPDRITGHTEVDLLGLMIRFQDYRKLLARKE